MSETSPFTSLETFPLTSNQDLTGPYRLSFEEFWALPVSRQRLEARQLIYALEAAIHRLDRDAYQIIDPDTLTPVHRFTKGIYVRELTMPAGSIIVGKRHKQEHLVTQLFGYCTIFTERGQEDLAGAATWVSPAGEKRVLFVHSETRWHGIHRTDETDLEAIERDLIITEPIISVGTGETMPRVLSGT